MAMQWALVLHGLATLVVVVLFLCRQWPIFRRTPIDSIRQFLTIGAYDYFLRCVGLPCGVRGTNAILVAIMEVGQVLWFYDLDRRFSARGFGGSTYEIEGVEGIMAAYAGALHNVPWQDPLYSVQ